MAEIKDLRFHDLRGRSATDMIEAGNKPAVVRKITGHATVEMLYEHYLRADVLTAKRIAASLDRFREDESLKESSELVN